MNPLRTIIKTALTRRPLTFQQLLIEVQAVRPETTKATLSPLLSRMRAEVEIYKQFGVYGTIDNVRYDPRKLAVDFALQTRGDRTKYLVTWHGTRDEANAIVQCLELACQVANSKTVASEATQPDVHGVDDLRAKTVKP